MRRLFYIGVLLFILILQLTYAGNTGKIVGRVIDKNSGDPLPGVNILLQGTYTGAATDLDGEYFILNIPPGTYKVECSYMGYNTVVIENIVVQSDQTTALDVKMQEQYMELDEQIVIVAERPLVHKDLTASRKTTTAEEIKVLPVETFSGILAAQAGVTRGADGALHIRGGRSNEISYLVDGISVANPYSTNGLATNVSTNAIQEMTVVSGAFNAEYGNAMSGVVNLTTKDGGNKFNGTIKAYIGDYISNNEDVFLDIDNINPISNKNFEGSLSGPMLDFFGKNNSFFMSARYVDNEGYKYGIREHNTSDSADFNGRTEIYYVETDEKVFERRERFYDEWYIERTGDGKIVSMNPSTSLNLLGKLKFQLNPSIIFKVQSIINDDYWKSYSNSSSHNYKYNPDGDYKYFTISYHNSLKLVHTLSASTYYELHAAFNCRKYKQYVYEDPHDPRYVPTDKIQGTPGGSTFAFGGTRMGHIYQDSKSYIGKFDITSQFNKRHLVKFGMEARLHKLNRENFTILYDRIDYNKPTILGLDSPYHDKYEQWPQEVSAYIQDKIEFNEMIVNIGLRYDYFYSNSNYAADKLQPDGEIKLAEPKHMVSPRLGVSFPITAEGIIHFSYGHFSQMPSFSALYVNPDFELPKSETPTFGNSNLCPQKTIMYEIGLQQQLTENIAIDVTGFYRDIRDLLARQTIKFRSLEGDLRTYRIYLNQDYGNVKGVTLTLSKRWASESPIAFKLDYTYQVVEGNDNDVDAFYYNSLSEEETIKEIIPLDWDQPHNLYGSVSIQPVDGLSVSLIGKLSSGYPYSPALYNQNYDTTPNSDRKPSQKTVDLQASYRFGIWGLHYSIFTKIYNLFDTKNERYVFNDTGRATYTYANKNQDETESLKKHYGEPGVHTYDDYINKPYFYRAPREVRLGLTIEL